MSDDDARVAELVRAAVHDAELPPDRIDLAEVRRLGDRRRRLRVRAAPTLAVLAAAASVVGIWVGVAAVAPDRDAPVSGPTSAVTSPSTSAPSPPPTTRPTTEPTPSPTSTTVPAPTTTGEPDAAASSGTVPAQPPATVVPLPPGASFPPRGSADFDPFAVASAIPDLRSVPTALPPGLQLRLDLGQYRLEPSVPGQSCDGADTDTVAGRQWSWDEAGTDRLDETAVGLVVTGWPTGTGHRAFADVVRDTGGCTWLETPHPVAVAVPAADESWAAAFDANGVPSVRGAARVGDLLVGVEVRGAGADGTAAVQRLLQAAVGELAADGPQVARG